MFRIKRINATLYGFTTLVIINFLLAMAWSTSSYVNSSFLSRFFNPETVSIIFSLSAAVAIFALIVIPPLIHMVGIRILAISIIPILMLAIILFGFSQNWFHAGLFFIIQVVGLYLFSYISDLYIEKVTVNESKTGNTRSIFLTSGNAAIFVSPLLIGLFVINDFYLPLYIFAAVILIPIFFFAITALKYITPKNPPRGLFIESIKELLCCRQSILYVIGASLLLNMFYAWVIIYAPLALIQIGGYSWQTIGFITAVALLPYIFLEIPLGWLADNYIGETEIMAVGFAILALSLIGIAFIPLSNLLLWSIPFFFARVGGAMVEIGSETYFFKQVNETNTTLVSIFRVMRPAGLLLAPLVALMFLPVTNLQIVFAVFASIMLIGVPLSLKIWDTK